MTYNEGQAVVTSPLEVISIKRTICAGYSNLLQALSQAQGIPCMITSGYALGNDTSGEWTTDNLSVLDSNHAWNEAFVNGRWVIMDATWNSNNIYISEETSEDRGQIFAGYFDISEDRLALNHKILSRGYTSRDDKPSYWSQDEISKAFATELIPYSLQGAYRNNITRSEFCDLIIKLIEKKNNKDINEVIISKGLNVDSSVFSDCSNSNVLAAYAMGIIKGKGNNKFDPNGYITRQEAAVLLKNTAEVLGLSISNAKSQYFNDSSNFASWSTSAIDFITSIIDKTNSKSVMGGAGNDEFSPNNTYTREQAYCTVMRLYNALI